MIASLAFSLQYNTQENPPHGHECVNATVSAHAFSEDGFQVRSFKLTVGCSHSSLHTNNLPCYCWLGRPVAHEPSLPVRDASRADDRRDGDSVDA
jgi:hypothetical protein